jgi:hypothetical protein
VSFICAFDIAGNSEAHFCNPVYKERRLHTLSSYSRLPNPPTFREKTKHVVVVSNEIWSHLPSWATHATNMIVYEFESSSTKLKMIVNQDLYQRRQCIRDGKVGN